MSPASEPTSEGDAEVPPAVVDSSRPQTARDGGADVACRGARISLLGAALDARCAISEREWNARVRSPRPDGGASGASGAVAEVRQRARRDGDRIVFSLVNEGAAAAFVPLRFHPAHPELAFSVLAASAESAVFALAPPAHDAPPAKPRAAVREPGAHPGGPRIGLDDAGSPMRVYHALIELPPHGAAEASLAIDPHIEQRLDRECSDAGPKGRRDAGDSGCLPTRLPKGRVVLHVGQLVAPSVESPPARVEWDAP